jgi:hypothetical protein
VATVGFWDGGSVLTLGVLLAMCSSWYPVALLASMGLGLTTSANNSQQHTHVCGGSGHSHLGPISAMPHCNLNDFTRQHAHSAHSQLNMHQLAG